MSDVSKRVAHLSPIKRALLELELEGRNDAPVDNKTDTVAIIGMGCRFPGGANNPEAFWRLLSRGVDAISEVPSDRWDVDAYYDPNPEAPGKMSTRWGGFLESVDQFDPHFFGISPREGALMDPQQRLLLEVSWEALENAGQAADKLSKSQAGVFVGISTNDYSQVQMKFGDVNQIDAYVGTGNALSVASGRLSYFLGLQGPCMSIDTACSSSLVAVHLATQSLLRGECELALAGGVNVMLSPEVTINFSKARMMAADGRCKTFDAAADGYVRGEGCGIVVLKLLSNALKDGDNILALVRGSSVNQDGRSGGLTVPNGLAQETLLRKTLASAGVKPNQVAYVEAHGTGTSLGDPIEVRALGAVFGEGRTNDDRLLIGSVKTNIGHLEAAAGVAGLIKVVLALQREIPPHIHLNVVNPHIPLDEIPIIIATRSTPWPAGKSPRIAGISSFGFSGTNAHVILEEPPKPQVATSESNRSYHLFCLSAKTEEALDELIVRYQDYLEATPEASLADICFTASVGRTHFDHRLAVVAGSLDELQNKLKDCHAEHKPPALLRNRVRITDKSKIAFFFTDQKMPVVWNGLNQFQTEATFRHALERYQLWLS
ncbi:MAG TPA: polyketide synthase, partial [Pyrinomonadaceae bacterium]|nr:polyketide synthase [Pyrinomonadaceae bacterium]